MPSCERAIKAEISIESLTLVVGELNLSAYEEPFLRKHLELNDRRSGSVKTQAMQPPHASF